MESISTSHECSRFEPDVALVTHLWQAKKEKEKEKAAMSFEMACVAIFRPHLSYHSEAKKAKEVEKVKKAKAAEKAVAVRL